MKKTNHINRTIIRALLPMVILLAACTADADYNDYVDNAARSNASLKIYATIDNSGWGASTRADKDATSFVKDDEIGVTISDNYSNKKYTFDGNGTFTTTDGVYYENMYEKATSAYYPYTPSGKYENVEAQNFLYATSTEGSIFKDYNGSSAPSINLTFKHAMARLKIKFQTKEGVDDDQFVNLTVDGLKTTGTFDTQTGEAIATGDAGTIKGTDGVVLDTIVFPQVPSDKKIKVTFNLRGYVYSTNISCDALEAGKNYEYTVQYERPTWFTNAAFARVGDYAGIHKDSNGNTDGKHFLASYAYEDDEQKSNVTGIVFWTSKQDKSGLTMSQAENKMTFTNGLIVRLGTDATKDKVVWQEKREENNTDNYGIVSLASYMSVYKKGSIDTGSIQGYLLSYAMETYNEEFGYGDDYQTEYYIKVFQNISTFSGNANQEKRYERKLYRMVDADLFGGSVWYIPSIKELELLFTEYKANDSRIKSALGDLNGVYWSSTEGDACTDGHKTKEYSFDVTNESNETTTISGTITNPTYSSEVYVYDNSGTGETKQEDKFEKHTVIQVCAF